MPSRRTVISAGAVTVIACTREEPERCSAEAGNCNKPATHTCSHPIRYGTKSKGRCGRTLCDAHAHAAGGGERYCPPHHRKALADSEGR